MTDPRFIAVRISVSKSKGLRIEWKDGHYSEFGLDYLRQRCPCATCTGAHGAKPAAPAPANPFQMYKPALKIDAIEPVGAYAIQIKWNDGHDDGIYSYEHLRGICPCPACGGA